MCGIFQEPLDEDGFPIGEESTLAEEAAAKEGTKEQAKGGTIKFGWVKGVLVSVTRTGSGN